MMVMQCQPLVWGQMQTGTFNFFLEQKLKWGGTLGQGDPVILG